MTPRDRIGACRLYLVCGARGGGAPLRAFLDAALRGGVDVVQLRDKALDDDGLIAAAASFRASARKHGALFILNDRPDLVAACRADGVHLGQDDMDVSQARSIIGPEAIIGLSTHSRDQIEAAAGQPVDYISVGPIWETPTKEGRPATGLDLLHIASELASIPWFAIGGIDRHNAGEVVSAGAERLCVVRAIRDAENPRQAAAALLDAVDPAAGAAPTAD
jgi:thiamine-phosphate pyrophosphorylase